MQSKPASAPERISSAATGFWKDFFPPLWTGVVGVGMMGVWFEWFGNPASMDLKLLGVVLWAGTSMLFRLSTRKLREVWMTDREVIVSSEGRRLRIPLGEVTEIKETRGQKIKTVRLHLRGHSALGSEVRFIPVHRGHLPFTDHPVVKELRQRKGDVAVGDGSGERTATNT